MHSQNFLKESTYHTNWQNSRIKFILSKYESHFFNKKRILELAPYNGYIGAYFNSLGADVYLLEGREENISKIKNDYPYLNCELVNLDTPDWNWGKWDIIINFGLYYHLEKFHKEHLENCLDYSNMMFFESVIYDSNKAEIFFINEQGDDQSLSDVGGNPTTSYVENIFINKNKKFEKFNDPLLNGDGHFYDWVDTGNNIFHRTQRRFWIVQ